MKLSSLKPKVSTLDIGKGSRQIYERITGAEAVKIRQRILLRDELTCQHCKQVFRPKLLQVDHITPLYLGGAESDENRQTLCIECHTAKTDREERQRT